MCDDFKVMTKNSFGVRVFLAFQCMGFESFLVHGRRSKRQFTINSKSEKSNSTSFVLCHSVDRQRAGKQLQFVTSIKNTSIFQCFCKIFNFDEFDPNRVYKFELSGFGQKGATVQFGMCAENWCKGHVCQNPPQLHSLAQPSAFLADVMSKTIYTATTDQLLEEIDHNFERVTGLPVIDKDLKCIGVISKKDKAKASKGLKSTVGEVMSSPAITLAAEKTVLDAAALMLKSKIHRIPIVNDEAQVV
ncbi:hypothetical protein KI387_006374, partial [Taxus chinensis]